MDCEKYQIAMGEDPASSAPDLRRHLAECPACTAFAARIVEAERRIQAALRFDVAALKAAKVAPGSMPRRTVFAGIAAVLAAAVALWMVLGVPTTEELAIEVAQHWYHEPNAWTRTDVEVSNVALNQVLAGQAELDLARLGRVTYAHSCLVGGDWIPHLVLQGRQGPIMLLLLPERALTSPVPIGLPEEGLKGRMLPHGGGSIAVLGEDGEAMQEVEERIAQAVQWTI